MPKNNFLNSKKSFEHLDIIKNLPNKDSIDELTIGLLCSDLKNGNIPIDVLEDTCFIYGTTGNCGESCPLYKECPHQPKDKETK